MDKYGTFLMRVHLILQMLHKFEKYDHIIRSDLLLLEEEIRLADTELAGMIDNYMTKQFKEKQKYGKYRNS